MRASTARVRPSASTRFSPRPSARVSWREDSGTTPASATRSFRRMFRCCRRQSPLPDLSVALAGIELKNPVIAGSGEATATADAIRAALDAGAGAVVAKSANESEAARQQLRTAEYVLVDERHETRPLGPAQRADSLFCRSGLLDTAWDEWVATLTALDGDAKTHDAYVVPSLIVSDVDEA